jgi:hypothetical protein
MMFRMQMKIEGGGKHERKMIESANFLQSKSPMPVADQSEESLHRQIKCLL